MTTRTCIGTAQNCGRILDLEDDNPFLLNLTLNISICLRCIDPFSLGVVPRTTWTLPGGVELRSGQSVDEAMVVNSVLVLQNPRTLIPDGVDGYMVGCDLEQAGFNVVLYSDGM